MRIHEPIFPEDGALFIIWCKPAFGAPFSVAAGGLRAMQAAWHAVQDDYPQDDLTLQNRARVLLRRDGVRP